MVQATHVLLRQQRPDIPNAGPVSFERDLLERARGGDSSAFARLFDLYADRVYKYMYLHLASEQVAEDLTARVYLMAWKNIEHYTPDQSPFGAWLYPLARKAVLDFSLGHRGYGAPIGILASDEDGTDGLDDVNWCSGNQPS